MCTCLLQLVAGTVAWASVLVTEAVHSALDGLSVGLSLIAVLYAARAPTPRMTYGYARAETLAAVVSILMLAMLCVKLFLGAAERLWYIVRGSRAPIHVQGQLVFAAESVTLLSNLLMAYTLTKLGGRASGSDAVSSQFQQNPELMSLNLRALRAHILADSVENLVVLFAGILMWLVPGASIIDPILTVVIVVLLVYFNIPIANEVARVILQATPVSIDSQDAISAITRIPDVISCGELHIWILTSNTYVATAHIQVSPAADMATLDQIRSQARSAFQTLGISEVTIEVLRAQSDRHSLNNDFGFSRDLTPVFEIDMDDLDDASDVNTKLLS
jgi:cobalt-zinc-cadmium efflux system protein